MLIQPQHPHISVRRQCELLELSRSSYYYEPVEVGSDELELMHAIDKLYTAYPFYGSRRIAVVLSDQLEQAINRKRVQRLMRAMGISGVQPRKSSSGRHPDHKIYPYLLRGVPITHVGHVFSTDITYIPLKHGFLYLVAVMDWYSRYILSYELSNSLHIDFCLEALQRALDIQVPEIFNTDQGSQFTSPLWTNIVEDAGSKVSMDGRGRALDNVWIERFWRSLKYEDVYLKEYSNGANAWRNISSYIKFYNTERPHQSLGYRTPSEVFHAAA